MIPFLVKLNNNRSVLSRMLSICLVDFWMLEDKSRRNAGESEEGGRSGDLSQGMEL